MSARITKVPRRYYAVCWRYGKGCYSEEIITGSRRRPWRVITTPIRSVCYFGSRAERDECVSTSDNPYDPGAPGYCEPIKRRELGRAELRQLHGY